MKMSPVKTYVYRGSSRNVAEVHIKDYHKRSDDE